MRYAKQNTISWTLETVDPFRFGWRPRIALDSNDYPHISYAVTLGKGNDKWTDYNLKYAYKSGLFSGWMIETIEFDESTGISNDIAIDSNDYPHIVYNKESLNNTDTMEYKFKSGMSSNWITRVVDTVNQPGHWCNIALDSNDYPHSSYSRGHGEEWPIIYPFMYAYWDPNAKQGNGHGFADSDTFPAKKPLELAQTSPNPAKGNTTFSFSLPKPTYVNLSIYDVKGRKLTTLFEGIKLAGSHEVKYDVHLNAGIYIYRLETPSETTAKKMVVTQ